MNKTYKRGLRVLAATALLAAAPLWGQTSKWEARAVSDNDNDFINDVAADAEGNSYTVGFFNGTGINFINLGTSANTGGTGTYDGFLAMHDRATGDVQWAVTVGGTGNDYAMGVSVYPENNTHAIYVCGHFNGTMTLNSTDGITNVAITAAGNQDAFIAKYDDAGIVQWAYAIGSTGNDAAYDIQATTGGILGTAIYVCGSYAAAVTFNGLGSNLNRNLISTGSDSYLVRYIDDPGTPDVYPDWARCMGSTSTTEAYYGLGADVNGNVVVTGYFGNANATYDISGAATAALTASGTTEAAAVCYNASGNRIWADHYGGNSAAAGVTDAGLCATMDANGNSYLGGYFTGIGVFDGGNHSNLAATGIDSYIICINLNGDSVWIETGGTTNTDDMVTALAIDNCSQHLYAGGQYRGAFTFSGITFNPYNAGTPNVDGFFITLDAADGVGIVGDGSRMGGSGGVDNRTAIAVNALEDVYVAGSFTSTDWFLGANYQFSNSNVPNVDGFLYRWDNITFPATVTSGTATHYGAGVDECTIYAAGEMNGANVQFGTTTLSSTVYSAGVYTQDVYLTTCDKFGTYASFTKVTNGTANEYMKDQYTDAAGNNYIGGYAQTTVSSPGNLTFNNTTTVTVSNSYWGWVCKTNSTGTVQWGNWITSSSGISTVLGVTTDVAGDVYACGYISGTVTFADPVGGIPVNAVAMNGTNMFVAKYNGTSGSLQWVQTFAPTTATNSITGYSISTYGNSYFVTGSFTGAFAVGPNNLSSTGLSDIFVMRGDTVTGGGTYGLQFNSTAGINDEGYDVLALSTNAVYVAGYSSTNAFIGRANLMTSTPSWTWTTTSTSANATGNRVESHNGFVYLGANCTSGTLTFGSVSCSTGACVVRFESGGTAQCAGRYASHTLFGLAIEAGSLNNDGGDDIVFTGGSSAYIHVWGATNCVSTERHGAPMNNAATSEADELSAVTVYPNPASDAFTLEMKTDSDLGKDPATLVITDISGRVVLQLNGITGTITTINTAAFESGMYQYQLFNGEGAIGLGKIVIRH